MKLKIPFSRTILSVLEMMKIKKELANSGWIFDKHLEIYLSEVKQWKKDYLPISVNGKIVLDIGAGEGESAKFFLDNGALIVYSIEADIDKFSILYKNSYYKSIIPIYKRFEISDLYLDNIDFIKIDIEGYEEELLNVGLPDIPMVVEIHGLQLVEKFMKKGFRFNKTNRDLWYTYGYWEC